MRRELDLNPLAHGLPRQFEQRLLQFGKPPFGRTDQITNRWIRMSRRRGPPKRRPNSSPKVLPE
jgi:hypothetical protein